MGMTLKNLARHIGADLHATDDADPQRVVVGCNRMDHAGPDEVTFLANPKYASQLKSTQAAAVIVEPKVNPNGRTLLRADDPYFAFRNAVVALHDFRAHPAPDHGPISPMSQVHPTARVGEQTHIHPFAVISEGARIGRRCVIYPHTFIGPGVRIGDDCQIYPNVTIYDHCVLGDGVTLHSGCVIGQDGFGYATHEGAHHKIPQTGNVVIEDKVEMGAGCAVDRATLGSTVIGEGTKFSDLIAIGHGSRVGKHNLLVALVGLAGSVETGDHVALGGQVGVAGHLRIGDRVQVAATSGVMSDIPDDAVYGGRPAQPINDAKRVLLHQQRLPDLAARLKQLEREVERLREQK